MNRNEIALSPICGWDVAPIAAYGAVMLQLRYLAHATQPPDEALQTPHFVMTSTQAQELIEALQRVLGRLRSGPAEGSGLPKH